MILPHGASIARLDGDDAPWPTASRRELGQRFLGYDLDERSRPTFRYDVGGVVVEDVPRPVAGESGQSVLERTLTLTSDAAASDLWLRAAAGEKVESLDDGAFRIDGRLTLRFVGASSRSPQVRDAVEGAELLFPLDVAAGSSEVTVRYAW